ncbi:hypothetical protein NC651_040461 [Populus alba x Populus x berolinensis]|nr:hypothetical protein NC651_040461 [Populus alba x Populus x berolinensis]
MNSLPVTWVDQIAGSLGRHGKAQDLSPASKTKECSLSVIRRAPLTEGATAEQTVGLQSQLAEVAAQEKLLIGECLELLQTVSILQVES